MTNKDLIKKLLDYPMDMEIYIDMHPNYNLTKPVAVGLDDDHKRIWITNYD